MSKVDNQIRSFGMSGLMIIDDFRQIEEQYTIKLGHNPEVVGVSQTEYYPQFEQSVRIEAAEMSHHYELFYCLENAIRKLITETLHDSVGSNWWSSGKIPPAIVQQVEDRIQKEIDSGVTRRSDAHIDFTTFGELSVIITANWDLFNTILSSRRAVEKVMSSLNLLRAPIAHCCPLSDDEIERLRLTVKDWFRMIG